MNMRTILCAVVLSCAVATSAQAQKPVPDYSNLKGILEKNYAPPATRSLAPSDEDGEEDKSHDKFYSIEQKEQPAPADGQPPAPRSDSRAGARPGTTADVTGKFDVGTWWSLVRAFIRDLVGTSEARLGENVAGSGTLTADTTSKSSQPSSTSTTKKNVQLAQAEVPIAKKNSFVLQLKPDAKEEDIARLLSKYGLKVTKVIGDLGIITCEPDENADAATRSLTRSDDNEIERTPDPKTKLQKILEPPIIKELRNESIVDAAIVNSTIGTKTLPKPSSATTQFNGKTFAWRWGPGETVDGNWGLKALRMPPVWTILERHRKQNPDRKIPKVGIIDAGFAENPNVPFQRMVDVQKVTVLRPNCSTHHGMHVAGIIGARQGDAPGVDGMIPSARMDAVAISNQATSEADNLGVEELWQLQTLLFDEVLGKTMDYLVDNFIQPDDLRVINISLGYNFLARQLIGTGDLDDVEGLKLHIHHQASMIRRMAQRVEDKILFVVAAGNDSEGRTEPLSARWASPFAWAGTHKGVLEEPATNILVVEASDRNRQRAVFSNTGGHISAPGVDIMSTLATGNTAFGVCPGTSQAAPFAAALAAILFELDPTKTPADVIDIMKTTATPAPENTGAAPSIDALEAVLRIAGTKALLTDLDEDGQVGASDLGVFKTKLAAITAAATTEAAFTEDLNGDGVIDDNECYWPRIDFNGSGSGATQPADFKKLGGLFRSDLNVMALAWSEPDRPFETAVADAGLAVTSPADILTVTAEGGASEKACRRKDAAPIPGSDIVAALETETSAAEDATGAVPTDSAASTRTADAETSASDTAGETDVAEGPAPADDTPASDEAATRGAAPAETEVAEGPTPSDVRAQVQGAVAELKKANPRLRITINPATGLPSSITGFLPRPAESLTATTEEARELTEEETKRAVEGFFATSGLTAAFPTQNKDARTAYTGRKRDPDFPDRYIATVEQRVGEIPVFGSSAKLTVEGMAGVTKYVGTPSRVAITDTTAEVSEADAITAARAKLEEVNNEDVVDGPMHAGPAEIPTGEAKAQLIIFDPALLKLKGPTRISWMVEIDGFKVFVDAKTKDVFHFYRDRPSGAARRIFDMEGGTTFPGKQILDEAAGVRAEDMPADGALSFRNTGDVRDFFFLVFGRDGFDDNDGPGPNGGSALESYIRYSSVAGAFWCTSKASGCPKANVMVYGPGYAGSLDIVGHEMTHGVISHEKNLIYMNESGAVNESLADIFGTLIELHANVPFGNWVIGESAPGFSEGSPLRSMADPNIQDGDGGTLFDRDARYSNANRGQPDHYEDRLTPADKLCDSTRYDDNGCVHFNSGILNKFAYLISEGGEHRGVTVEGIGRVKLARIAYRTMTVQLNEASGLIEAADGFALSCLELADAGAASIDAGDCEQVFSAQLAVGLIYGGS